MNQQHLMLYFSMTRYKMALKLGCHRSTIGRWVKAKRFNKLPPGWVWSEKEQIFKLVEQHEQAT